jgi:hypothetical protein
MHKGPTALTVSRSSRSRAPAPRNRAPLGSRGAAIQVPRRRRVANGVRHGTSRSLAKMGRGASNAHRNLVRATGQTEALGAQCACPAGTVTAEGCIAHAVRCTRSAPFRRCVFQVGRVVLILQLLWVASHGPCRLMAEAGAHLVGVRRREFLRVPKHGRWTDSGAGRVGTDLWANAGWAGYGAVGRALIGSTFAFSSTKGMSTSLHSTPLYQQVPSAFKPAASIISPCFHRRYTVSPSA